MIGQALIPIPGVGAVVGGLVGSQVGQGITRGAQRLAGSVVGIDPSDPLSGPDWNLGGIALTPYAKTKKRTKVEGYKDDYERRLSYIISLEPENSNGIPRSYSIDKMPHLQDEIT